MWIFLYWLCNFCKFVDLQFNILFVIILPLLLFCIFSCNTCLIFFIRVVVLFCFSSSPYLMSSIIILLVSGASSLRLLLMIALISFSDGSNNFFLIIPSFTYKLSTGLYYITKYVIISYMFTFVLILSPAQFVTPDIFRLDVLICLLNFI